MATAFEVEFSRFITSALATPTFVVLRGDFRFEHTQLYLRIGPRLIGSCCLRCLQIANVETPEAEQSKGSFKRFLLVARSLTDLPFYVENSTNARATSGLIKHGFTIITKPGVVGPPDLYRLT